MFILFFLLNCIIGCFFFLYYICCALLIFFLLICILLNFLQAQYQYQYNSFGSLSLSLCFYLFIPCAHFASLDIFYLLAAFECVCVCAKRLMMWIKQMEARVFS